MTVAEVNALLYSSRHPRDQLERALRIPALSPGWRWSFEALLRAESAHPGASGNAGLAPAAAASTARPGFRPMQVSRIDRECADVISLSLQPTDRRPLTRPLAGQFVVFRLRPSPDGPPLFRSYSLSGPISEAQYRVSVKLEPDGAAAGYLNERRSRRRRPRCQRTPRKLHLAARRRAGGAAERGNRRDAGAGHAACPGGERLASGGLVAARRAQRKLPSFAVEVRQPLGTLARGRGHVWYSRPDAEDREGQDYDARGRLEANALDRLRVPRDGDFYLCGPSSFLDELTRGLGAWGVPAAGSTPRSLAAARR